MECSLTSIRAVKILAQWHSPTSINRLNSGRVHPHFESYQSSIKFSRAVSRFANQEGPRDGSSDAHNRKRPQRPSRRNRRKVPKASLPGQFEVVDVSPPPKHLGIHVLPPKTHNGDQLSVCDTSCSDEFPTEEFHTETCSTSDQMEPNLPFLIQIEGKEYVVTSLVLQYKLQRGRYVRDNSQLRVLATGRFLYNEYLSAMMEKPYTADDDVGKQD